MFIQKNVDVFIAGEAVIVAEEALVRMETKISL